METYFIMLWIYLGMGHVSTTTPVCQVSDGMESVTTIPSSEISINDAQGDVDYLRPNSQSPLESSVEKLIIEYTPSKIIPVEEVELTSSDNIKSYTVIFYNDDGTVITREVISILFNKNMRNTSRCDILVLFWKNKV